jgi:hypothetical protein
MAGFRRFLPFSEVTTRLFVSPKAALAQQTLSLRHRIGVVSAAAPIADLTEDSRNSDVYPSFFKVIE